MRLDLKAKERAKPDEEFDAVHNDILRRFSDLVVELGGDSHALLRWAGIEPSCSTEGKSGAGYRQIISLLEHAAVELRCPDFGMRLATLQGGSRVFGSVGVVMKNSDTLGTALEYVKKHSYAHSLAARIRLERGPTSHQVVVSHDILLDRLPTKCQVIEQILLLGNLNVVEITGGRARARKVVFRHQPVSSLATYRRYFGCAVHFDQKEDGLVFSDRDLLCPIVDRDACIHDKAVSSIEKMYTRINPPLHAQVRGVIMQSIVSEHCNNTWVAAELHLHPRTLHRRLNAEGKSFQEIKDEVRRDLALYYLQQTDLDVTHIAERLGYAEHSVLTRSCVRWFSMPPSRLRSRAHDSARKPGHAAIGNCSMSNAAWRDTRRTASDL